MSQPIANSAAVSADPSVAASQTPIAYAQAKKDYTRQHDRLVKATQDFEAVYIGLLLKQVRKSMAGDNPLFGNGSEAKVYQGMMDDAMAKQISHAGSFGIAKVLYKSLAHTLPPDPDAALRQALLGF